MSILLHEFYNSHKGLLQLVGDSEKSPTREDFWNSFWTVCFVHAGRFPNLDNVIEEGICQVIAHMWLSSELESLTRRGGSPISKRLGEFFLHQIETDSSPTYGDGFRAAYAAVATYGLTRTLHHLRHTGEIIR